MRRSLLIKGFNLSAVSILSLFMAFGSNVILARLLAPEDFGKFFFIYSTLGVLYSFFGFNLNLNVIQKKEINQRFWGTVLFLVYIVGIIEIVIALILYYVYKDIRTVEHALFYLLLLAIASFVTLLSSVVVALDERNLNYNRVAGYEFVSNNIPHIVAIFLAFLSPGAWVLFLREFLKPCLRLGIALQYIRPNLIPKFNWRSFQDIFDYTKHVYLSQLCEGIAQRIDKWFLGHFFGKTELGFYSLAYRLSFLGHQILEPIAVRFSLGVFARKGENQKVMLYSAYTLMFLIFVFSITGLVIYFFGKKLIIWVYGEKWIFTYKYLVAFIPFIIFLTPLDHLRAYFFAKGIPKIVAIMRFLYVSILILGLSLNFYLNLLGIFVGVLLSFANFLGFLFMLWWMKYSLKFKIIISLISIMIIFFWWIGMRKVLCG